MNEKKGLKLDEIIKFLVSGGICFVVQFVLLKILRDNVGLNTLVALLIAFLAATVVNYILSVLWIWPSAKGSGTEVKIGFLVTSFIALLLNELLVWLLGLIFGEDPVLFSVMGREVRIYMINACVTTVLVMFWNFFTKRAILQSSLIQKLMKKGAASGRAGEPHREN